MTKRIPKTLFFRAYFENTSTTHNISMSPAMEQLHDAVIAAYGFNMLYHIEHLEQSGRLSEAVEGFDEQGNWRDK